MIQRKNHGRGHTYVDSVTGERIPGVTSITSDGVPKPALLNWAVTTTADFAIDQWARLSELTPSERRSELVGARWESNTEAKARGTQVHRLAEKLVEGKTVRIPDGLDGFVKAYVAFLDEYDVQPLEVEQTIYSPKHKYCGTFDLIADLLDPEDLEADLTLRTRQRWLLDIKTSRSGVFGETALQLAAYRYAEHLIREDGSAEGMPEVERCGVVHVRPDGYQLVPVDATEIEHRAFLYVQQVSRFLAGSRDLVGEALVSPQTSTYRLVQE